MPDNIGITSDVGTWAAVAFAILALIGIIGPYLALQAALSDTNRAMNAIQDRDQKYISRGWHLWNGLYIFRKIKVPDLAPAYKSNELEVEPLVKEARRAAQGRWVLRPTEFARWNTGWAKLAELLQAYQVRDGVTNTPVELGVAKEGGNLEVVNSRTALVVSKHWILLIGLLGRYGMRKDKGVLQMTGIRRNFQGERAEMRNFVSETERVEREPSDGFDRVIAKNWHKKHLRVALKYSRSDSNSESSSSESESESEIMKNIVIERGPYGGWKIQKQTESMIYGITGTIQAVGRNKGDWSYLTSIAFVPHTEREIFPRGRSEKSDRLSLQDQFWLAHGFLPCSSLGGQQTVISMESPEDTANDAGRSFRRRNLSNNKPAFQLREGSNDIPVSIGNAMRCLGIPPPLILQFLPIEPHEYIKFQLEKDNRENAENTSSRVSVEAEDTSSQASVEETEIISIISPESTTDSNNDFEVQGPWVHYPARGWVISKKDLSRVLRIILSFSWDEWGCLIWRDWFWSAVLKPATNILRRDDILCLDFTRAFGMKMPIKALGWHLGREFHPQKTLNYLAFDEALEELLKAEHVRPLRLALGSLFMIDGGFRRQVEKAIANLCKNIAEASSKDGLTTEQSQADDRSIQDAGIKKMDEECSKIEEKVKAIEKSLKDMEKAMSEYEQIKKVEHEEAKEREERNRGPVLGSELVRPIYTRMSLEHLSITTLKFFDISFERQVC